MKRFVLGAALAATLAATAATPAAAYWHGYYGRPYYVGYGYYRPYPVYVRPYYPAYYYAPPVYYAPAYAYPAPAYGYGAYPVYRCRDTGGGAVLGAIAGGLIGAGVSHRYDRGFATVAGAGVGAAVGDSVERHC